MPKFSSSRGIFNVMVLYKLLNVLMLDVIMFCWEVVSDLSLDDLCWTVSWVANNVEQWTILD